MPEVPIPETLDGSRYHIEKVLGAGGTAVVLLAMDTRMGVHRAIKLLHPEYARSAEVRARLKREAHAQASLKHPNVLMVHDAVEDEQGVYLVMEYAEADSLGQRVARSGPLSARETVEVGVSVGGALAVAHAAGLIHRDIKPANILVDRHGVLKLADFGIARLRQPELELTRDGMVMGTWAFMPPEQRESTRDADLRSDIYAFGVTLYALRTGRQSTSLHNQEGWAEAFAGVEAPLAAVIQRATRLYPEDRYQRVEDMVTALRQVHESLSAQGPEGPTEANAAGIEPTLIADSGQVRLGGGWTAVPVSTPLATPTVAMAPVESTEALPAPPAGPSTTARRALPVAVGIGAAFTLLAGFMAFNFIQNKTVLFDDPYVGGQIASPIPPPPTVEPPQPEDPPSEGPRTDPTPAGVGAPTETRSRDANPSDEGRPARRIITVLPEGGSNSTESGRVGPAPRESAVGELRVRTVPSRATVRLHGRNLSAGPGGTYALPPGSHTLELESPEGEKTRLAVSVRVGETVEVCYNFDTNSSCGGAP